MRAHNNDTDASGKVKLCPVATASEGRETCETFKINFHQRLLLVFKSFWLNGVNFVIFTSYLCKKCSQLRLDQWAINCTFSTCSILFSVFISYPLWIVAGISHPRPKHSKLNLIYNNHELLSKHENGSLLSHLQMCFPNQFESWKGWCQPEQISTLHPLPGLRGAAQHIILELVQSTQLRLLKGNEDKARFKPSRSRRGGAIFKRLTW